MPFIDTRQDSGTVLPTINLHPSPAATAQLLVDLVTALEWTSFTILFESGEWLPQMSELLKIYDSSYTITARRIDLGLDPPNFRAVLRKVKLSPERRIIVECSTEKLDEILKQMQQVGLMTDQHHFIITNYDTHTIDVEPYQYSGTRITTLRVVDLASPILEDMAKYLEETAKKAEEVAVTEEAEKSEEENEDDYGEPEEGKQRREGKSDEDDGAEEEGAGGEDGEGKEEEEKEEEKESSTEKPEAEGEVEGLVQLISDISRSPDLHRGAEGIIKFLNAVNFKSFLRSSIRSTEDTNAKCALTRRHSALGQNIQRAWASLHSVRRFRVHFECDFMV